MNENILYLYEGELDGKEVVQVRATSKGITLGIDGQPQDRERLIESIENSLHVINVAGVEVFKELEKAQENRDFSAVNDKLPEKHSPGTFPLEIVENPFTN